MNHMDATATPDSQNSCSRHYSPDGMNVAFVCGSNLYLQDLHTFDVGDGKLTMHLQRVEANFEQWKESVDKSKLTTTVGLLPPHYPSTK